MLLIEGGYAYVWGHGVYEKPLQHPLSFAVNPKLC